MKYEADVCIVGAGPGGALLAYLLAKQNISVLLLEKSATIGKAFRGEHLNEEGEAILKKHRLFEALEESGLLRMEQLELWQDGVELKKILPHPQIGHLSIHVPQVNLLSVILNEAKKFPHFTLMLETNVEKLLQNESGHYCGVLARHNEHEIEISSKLIVGADGRYSTIRRQSNIEMVKRKHGFDLLWARIPTPIGWKPSIKMTMIDGKQLALFTQAQGYIQIGWNIDQGSFSELRKQPFTLFIDQLIKAFPMLTEAVQKHIKSWQDFVLLDVFSSQCKCWGTKGLVLLGDAVHTMTPTGAFGLNSALKDADCLASLIAERGLQGFDVTQYENLRQAAIEEVQAIQIEKEQSFSSQFKNKPQ
ncbi:MAG: FAD-dependent monooxygenase [Lysinibacillus sp.]